MSYLIATLAVVALLSFVYESILAPSLRLTMRFELFALRDDLRRLKIVGGVSDRHFQYLQDSINTLISVLHRFDLAAITGIERELQRNVMLRQYVAARSRVLEDCRSPAAAEIYRRTLRIAVRALLVNSGAWVIYVGPVVAAFSSVSKLKASFKATLDVSVSLRERELQRLLR